MYTTEKMVQEHQDILLLGQVMKRACIGILDGQSVNLADFRAAVSFIRGYADQYHHAKEEKFLFNEMIQHLGPVAEKMIKFGMLADHNLARYQVMKLEEALNQYEQTQNTPSKLAVLTHMIGYVDLLAGHIDREDHAVYPFAEKNLIPKIRQAIDEKTAAFEADLVQHEAAAGFLEILKELAIKYPDLQ